MHNSLVVNANFFKIILELGEVPFRSIFAFFFRTGILVLSTIGTRVLNIVFVFLIHRIVSQVYVPLINIFLAVGVLLSGETDEAFLEEIDFERVEARYEGVDS